MCVCVLCVSLYLHIMEHVIRFRFCFSCLGCEGLSGQTYSHASILQSTFKDKFGQVHRGPDPQKDCAAFAAAKPANEREKKSAIHKARANGELHTNCTATPSCTCPICMHVNEGILKNFAQKFPLLMQINLVANTI